MHISEHLKVEVKKSPSQERSYWIEEILKHIQESNPKATINSVMWRINTRLKPCDTDAVRNFHYLLKSELEHSRGYFKNYAHVFNAKTKV